MNHDIDTTVIETEDADQTMPLCLCGAKFLLTSANEQDSQAIYCVACQKWIEDKNLLYYCLKGQNAPHAYGFYLCIQCGDIMKLLNPFIIHLNF